MALTQQLNDLHVPNNVPATVINYYNNDDPSCNNTSNISQTTVPGGNNMANNGVTHGNAGNGPPTTADEEMWDDVLWTPFYTSIMWKETFWSFENFKDIFHLSST